MRGSIGGGIGVGGIVGRPGVGLNFRPQLIEFDPHRRDLIKRLADHAVEFADEPLEVRELFLDPGEAVIGGVRRRQGYDSRCWTLIR